MRTVTPPADETPQPHRPEFPRPHWAVIDAYIADRMPWLLP